MGSDPSVPPVGGAVNRLESAYSGRCIQQPDRAIARTTTALTVGGWAPRYTTLRLYDNGGLAATLAILGDPWWSVPMVLADGTHAITATSTDNLGRISPQAALAAVVVDTVPPDVPVVEPLPAFQQGAAVTPSLRSRAGALRWESSDPAPGTGVHDYDVQHRQGTEEWTMPLAGTTATETVRWPEEGRPTVAVTAAVPGVNLVLAEHEPENTVSLTTTWAVTWGVTGLNMGDYLARFVGVDQEGYVGHGESLLRVQNPPPVSLFTSPQQPITLTSRVLEVAGRAASNTLLRLYDNGTLARSLAVGSGAYPSWWAALDLAIAGAHRLPVGRHRRLNPVC